VTRHVVLLGLMGAGKTSIGRLVAARLHRELVDGDVVLDIITGGRTAADIAAAEGIDALHEREARIALEALAASTPSVIGPAASVIERDDVRDRLREHTVVWLTAPADYLASRAVKKSHRPLLDDGDLVSLFERQAAVRDPLARALASLVIDVTTMSKRAAARAIADVASAAN
jgi:shikimate kinase